MTATTRKLAAIVFTDIAGFTAISAEDEEKALAIINRQRELLKPIVEEFCGSWLKEIGDGLLLSFSSTKQAVECSIEIQKNTKDVEGLNLRIGIHQGDILEEDGDIFGDDVNIASRIEPFAAVGGIAITDKVYRDISGSPEITSKYVGKPRLKGVTQEVNVYCISSHGLPATNLSEVSAKLEHKQESIRRPSKLNAFIFGGLIVVILSVFFYQRLYVEDTRGSASYKSIAVLPFTTFSNEQEDLFFTDGVHDDILMQLAKIGDLKVISRTSVIRYRDTQKSMREIAGELNVANILEGSVRRAGDRIRIVAQLIKANTDEHLWAETYDRDYNDIFTIQSDVAQKIASALKATLTQDEKSLIELVPTENMEAYDYYLKGNYFWYNSDNLEGLEKAVEMYQSAVEIDPAYAQAYARLSVVHVELYEDIDWDPTTERLEKGKAALDKAFELGPDLPETHFARGVYFQFGLRNTNRALEEFKIVLKSRPNDSEVVELIGLMYQKKGMWERAEEYLLKSYDLNPQSLTSAVRVATLYWLQRNWIEAEWYANKSLNTSPENFVPYWYKSQITMFGFGDLEGTRVMVKEGLKNVKPNLASLPWQLEIHSRQYSKALEELEYDMLPAKYYMRRGITFQLMRDTVQTSTNFDTAKVLYEKLIISDPNRARYHSSLGITYAGLGMKEEAIREGQEAVEIQPISKDATAGPVRLLDLGYIYVMVGEYDLAIDQLDLLLSIPSTVSKWRLKLDPRFDPLRNYQRFQKLIIED